MGEYGEKTLDKMTAVYEDVGRDHLEMPPWEEVGSDLRMAFIAVYFLGRRDLSEVAWSGVYGAATDYASIA